jgi:hypothetical protein
MLKILTFIFLTSFLSTAQAQNLTESELETLKKGELITHPLQRTQKNDPFGGYGYIIINKPLDTVWNTLMDWNSYQKIFPYTIETKELARRGNQSLIRQTLGYKLIKVVYHVSCSLEKPALIFKLANNFESDIDGVYGYWKLYPYGDGTLVEYAVAVNVPKGIVNFIGSSLSNSLQKELVSLPLYLKRWLK